jgi:hypothetical protein
MRRHTILIIVVLIAASTATQVGAQARLEVMAPLNGSTIDGTSVAVDFVASGISIVPSSVPLEQAGLQPEANRPGEGHVHFMLDTWPVVVWERNETYVFNDVPPGEHQLMVELVENDHSPLSPPVVQQIRFRTVSNQVMPKTGEPQTTGTNVLLYVLLAGVAMVGSGIVLRRATR